MISRKIFSMTTITALKKRLDQFQPIVDGKPAYFFINLRGDTPVSIPNEYEPKKDVLFETVYLEKDGSEPEAVSKVTWRGKPFHESLHI